uniref:TonB-dependent receptor domain-containing protein n=1 Tax=Maribacter polysiphoniae TaxID=429344 RepID=UPI00235461DB
ITGVVNSDPGNVNLTWETSDQLDTGFDLTILNNRITIVGDYYQNTTSGLLLNKQIPLSSGFPGGYLTNIGRMRNWGYEFSLSADIIDNEDWKWSLGGNVTRNWNKVIDLGGADQIQKWFGVLRHVPGREFKEIYGVHVIGVARNGDGSGITPGDLIFKDVDGDGAIGSFVTADGVPIGSPNQDWAFGATSTLRYKRFTLSTLLQGQAGAQMQDFNLNQIANGANINNVSKRFHYNGRYIDENNPGNGIVPRAGALVTSSAGVGSVSSIAIQSTDYLRIKNISLSYAFKNDLLADYGINKLSLYTSIENLYTFTNFIGGNPDAVNGSIGPVGPSRLSGISDGREIGINVMASQPLPRIMTLGLNVSF